MFGDSMLTNMLPVIEKAVDDYVEENGEQIICAIVHEEKEKLLAKPLSDAALLLDRTEIDLEAAVLKIYEDFVEAKAAVFIRQLDAGSIAEKAILDMDNIQLENLVLSAMKTEL